MLTKTRKFAIAAAATLMMALPASAATLDVTMQGKNAFVDAAGKNGWYQTTTVSLDGHKVTAATGVFRLTATDAGGAARNFLAFCLEPLEALRMKQYTVGSSLGATAIGRLSALAANAFSLVRDARSAAAFQLAAWEIATETRGKLALDKGDFKVVDALLPTRNLAQGWLDLIGSGAWGSNREAVILKAGGTQDLVTDIAPVPVPAAGLLLIGGLGGLAALRRRKSA